MRSDDDKWFDALAGHEAPASADEARMHSAIRKAAARIEAGQEERDMLAERRLLQRLEREGLLAHPPAQGWRPVRWAQAAVIVLCVGLSVELIRTPSAPQLDQDALPLTPAADMPVAQEQAAQAPLSSSYAMAKEEASRQANQALKSAPPVSSESALARDQAAGDSAPSPMRESRARAAPPAEIRVPVAQRSQAWRELQALLESDTGLVMISSDSASGRMSLRCDTQTSCHSLRDWLHAFDRTLPTPEIGAVMRLRLEPRS